ncbi:PI-stichotoxin-She2b-like [Octopus sinensis]|uniref:PI-stichotoxin-She2b-like n=1 Tax=Octopus sinensis TaxID=2607531 RepID=A0A6P7U0G3_9MOLL|nr:PI-stichotoxin-She2b-like [Octopus sinensis]
MCLILPEKGSCSGYQLRWYYNIKTGDCKTFVYGGCKGNENNFKTLFSCRMTFADYGNCKGKVLRYYHKNGICHPFYYSGCGGNNNNFININECKKYCIDI